MKDKDSESKLLKNKSKRLNNYIFIEDYEDKQFKEDKENKECIKEFLNYGIIRDEEFIKRLKQGEQ